MSDKIERRDFLKGLGILGSAAAAALTEQSAFAQTKPPTGDRPMADNVTIVDFHTHHIPARFEVTAGHTAPANQRGRWEALARKLADENLLLQDIRDGRIRARIVNIPAQLIGDADCRV